jgi:hypothetical protein
LAYTPNEWLRRRLLTEARSFGIVIALHHASRSVSLQRPQRMRDAIRFLQLTLAIVAPGQN